MFGKGKKENEYSEASRRGRDFEEEDDGRTIADMSQLRPGGFAGWRKSGSGMSGQAPGGGSGMLGQDFGGGMRSGQGTDGQQQSGRPKRPWENAPIGWKERWMYVLGAMKAALLLGLVYLGALAFVIIFLLVAWR